MKSMIYAFIILILLSVLAYIIWFTKGLEDILLLYFAIGITAALCIRMFISDLMDYQNEICSPVKNVVDTRILHRDAKTITIGNQRFKPENIILDSSEFDELKTGDHVRVNHSAKSHTIFSVKKI